MNLDGAIPTEHVMPSCSNTRRLISVPISRPEPSKRLAPVTSKNASSSESGSTSGVKSANIFMMASDTSEYRT